MMDVTWLRRTLSVGCVVALMFSVTGLMAHAEDLSEQKSRVTKELAHAKSCVADSSAALAAAEKRVKEAQTRVANAQATVDAAEAEVKAAEAVAALKAAELEQANIELADARAKEAAGQAKVDAQREAVAMYARSIYQDNMPLISVATLLNTDTTASLANRVQWSDTVLVTNQVDLDYLRVIQIELAAARAASQAAQVRAEEAKAAADKQILVTQTALNAAETARDELQSALSEQESARGVAADELKKDKKLQAEMEAELKSVNAKIAEEARKAAEANSPQSSSSGLIWPVNGPITDNYGYRIHPIYGDRRFHDGLDIGAGCGVPVKAVASGKVSSRYYSSGYGYRLFIDHGMVGGRHMVSAYNHMSGYAVSAGASVKQGQTIGYIGTTGTSTGCHMHLMLWVGGSLANPRNYLP